MTMLAGGALAVRLAAAMIGRWPPALAGEGLFDEVDEVWVTAGGSAFFDTVAEELAPLAGPRTRVVVRAGAYLAHDDGFYRGISPFGRGAGEELRPALHGWARVLSTPEPGLALLDAGKRDLPV